MTTFDDALDGIREIRQAHLERCKAAGIDPDEADRLAEVCHVELGGLARRFPDDWASKLRHRARVIERDQAAKRQRAFRSVISAGEGPESAVDLGLEGVRRCVPSRLLAFLDRWQPSEGGLVLSGPTEAGKSMAMLSLAWRLFERGDDVCWAQAGTLARLRDEHRLGSERPDLERRACRAEVLCLDDLLYAGHRLDVVLEVGAARMNAGRATVTTTGWSRQGLQSKLGDSGLRRLLRVGATEGRFIPLDAREPEDTNVVSIRGGAR